MIAGCEASVRPGLIVATDEKTKGALSICQVTAQIRAGMKKTHATTPHIL
jgi:hypothetical protein